MPPAEAVWERSALTASRIFVRIYPGWPGVAIMRVCRGRSFSNGSFWSSAVTGRFKFAIYKLYGMGGPQKRWIYVAADRDDLDDLT